MDYWLVWTSGHYEYPSRWTSGLMGRSQPRLEPWSVVASYRYPSLICSIQQLVQKDWRISLYHLNREGNRSADSLAQLGREGSDCLTIWDMPPAETSLALAADATLQYPGGETGSRVHGGPCWHVFVVLHLCLCSYFLFFSLFCFSSLGLSPNPTENNIPWFEIWSKKRD